MTLAKLKTCLQKKSIFDQICSLFYNFYPLTPPKILQIIWNFQIWYLLIIVTKKLGIVIIPRFLRLWYFSKEHCFLENFSNCYVILTPWRWRLAKIWYNFLRSNFHVNFKCLIGLALVIQKSVKPTPYFEGSKAEFVSVWSIL